MTNPSFYDVLLLEANEDIYRVISKTLQAFDLTLKRVADISDAELILGSSDRYKLIIFGTGFPDHKTINLVRQIRILRDVPVILMLDEIDTEKIKAALDAGVSRYLVTAFLPGNLSTVIRDFLKSDQN
jgi:DNA-binding response OmpR family regulator